MSNVNRQSLATAADTHNKVFGAYDLNKIEDVLKVFQIHAATTGAYSFYMPIWYLQDQNRNYSQEKHDYLSMRGINIRVLNNTLVELN
jgi:succinylglutamate desuccinylase